MKIKLSNYKYRYLARVIVEAKTPLMVGSGMKDIVSDALVATDVNGLPYIPGTSIAGVVRSLLDPQKEDTMFGFQNNNEGHGSEIIFTEAKVVNSKGIVVDGIKAKTNDEICEALKKLPIRQHVCINGKGTSDKGCKFDEQVIYAGTRFCFEFEILSESNDNKQKLNSVISVLYNPQFRIGGGSRSGFGKIEPVSIKYAIVDPTDKEYKEQLNLYLEKDSNLEFSGSWAGWKDYEKNDTPTSNVVEYSLTLRPKDFFMFGSGYGDNNGDADMTGVRASRIVWKQDKAELENQCVLLPASSLKGALRHRVAFHYNRLSEAWVGSGKEKDADSNDAVKAIFGSLQGEGRRGNALFSDIIIRDKNLRSKFINHVAIDRFTGGSIDGALFTEYVDYGEVDFETTIVVIKDALSDDKVIKAFELALDDLINGMLPLGGGVNRGNGIFKGVWNKNE